eukprot:4320954-Karenia_brevis.AAC.1
MQAKHQEHKCQRYRNCQACYFKKHHGVVLCKQTAQIMKQLNKYWKEGKVIDHEVNQEDPTRGTAVSQSMRKLIPPQIAKTTD